MRKVLRPEFDRDGLAAAKRAWFSGDYDATLRLCDAAQPRDDGARSEIALLRARTYLRLRRAAEAKDAVTAVEHPAGDAAATAMMLLGAAIALLGPLDDGLALLEYARASAQHPMIHAEIAWHRAYALYVGRRLDEVEFALAGVSATADIIYARALYLRAWVAMSRERYQDAVPLFGAALDHLRTCVAHDAGLVQNAVHGLATIAGETDEIGAGEIAVAHLDVLMDGETKTRSLEHLAWYEQRSGVIQQAYAYARRASESARTGPSRCAAFCTCSQIAALAGEPLAAADFLAAAREAIAGLPDDAFAAGEERFALLSLAECLALAHPMAAARYCARYESLAALTGGLSLGAGDRRLDAYLTYVRGLIHFGQGHRDRALRELTAAQTTFASLRYVRLAGLAGRAIALVVGRDGVALTASERRVLAEIGHGALSTVALATATQRKPKTVKNLVSSIMRKYGVTQRLDLVAIARGSTPFGTMVTRERP